MEVWWTATPELPVISLGLWRTKAEAEEYIALERLGSPHDCFQPVPIVIDEGAAPDGDRGDANRGNA